MVKVDVSESSVTFDLKSFYNAEFLRADVIERQDLHLVAHNFFNLTRMELGLFHYYLLDWVIVLLHCCPHLQNLVIDKMNVYWFVPTFNDDQKWIHPQFVPDCLISKLKEFRVSKYEGKDHELQFTRFIIQNAKVLRKATICSRNDLDSDEKLKMIKELCLCPRASVTCQLSFE